MKLTARLLTAAAAAALPLAAAPAAHAGVIDGSLNNAQVALNANVLGLMLNTQLQDASNNNANTKAQGKENNAINN